MTWLLRRIPRRNFLPISGVPESTSESVQDGSPSLRSARRLRRVENGAEKQEGCSLVGSTRGGLSSSASRSVRTRRAGSGLPGEFSELLDNLPMADCMEDSLLLFCDHHW